MSRFHQLLDAANRERLAGCHPMADALLWLMTVNTEPVDLLPKPPSEDVQRRRQAVKDSFSTNPFFSDQPIAAPEQRVSPL